MSKQFVICGWCLLFANIAWSADRISIGTDLSEPPITRQNTERIEMELLSETACSLNDVPLAKAMAYFGQRHHFETWIDKQSLQDEGVAEDQRVTLVVSGVALETALDLILDPLGLDYIAEDGVLKILTLSKADEKMSTRVYPVADLLSSSYAPLIELIMNGTGAKWVEVDQEGGTITPFRNSRSLLIRQTQRTHREIEGILTALRESKRMRVHQTSMKERQPRTRITSRPAVRTHAHQRAANPVRTVPQPVQLFSAGG